ncbi:uncharacterized protein LOC123293763 [Chrysoperla carnea]|uniref:uncharacterized protein LOC123293763 n=1 Tax=Chrysoperla carnea TaxID=189513 RepID=UPI001D06517C|nr:uncharacterized protein LOC123293763 [Chrysoperla carnea]
MTAFNLKLLLILLVHFECLIHFVTCHGLLLIPVNRASIWRDNKSAPIDYDDNQGFCGGFQVQWEINKGKCGICGDDYRYPVPRSHEYQGPYGRSGIMANYTQGTAIQVTTLLTANHLGWIQFSLCNLDNRNLETEDCFQNLEFTNNRAVYDIPEGFTGLLTNTIILPKNLRCKHCVLRWHYRTGNNWGICEDGSGKLGCGPQENFRSCSDISIQ